MKINKYNLITFAEEDYENVVAIGGESK